MQNLVVNYILTDIYHIYIYIHTYYIYIYLFTFLFIFLLLHIHVIYICMLLYTYICTCIHIYNIYIYKYIRIWKFRYKSNSGTSILGLHANIFTRNLQFDIVEYIFRSCDHIQQTLKFRQKQFDCPSNELYISSIYHAPKIQTSHRKFFVCFRRVPPNKCLVVDVFNVLMWLVFCWYNFTKFRKLLSATLFTSNVIDITFV